MKNKIILFLTNSLFIVVFVFFSTWGISFLISQNIYSIKDNEKVEVFIETNKVSEDLIGNFDKTIKDNNKKIYQTNVYYQEINGSFDTLYNDYTKCDLYILSKETVVLNNFEKTVFDYFYSINYEESIHHLNNEYKAYISDKNCYGYKIYEANNNEYNKMFNLSLKCNINNETDYYLFINHNSKHYDLNKINYSFIFDVINLISSL